LGRISEHGQLMVGGKYYSACSPGGIGARQLNAISIQSEKSLIGPVWRCILIQNNRSSAQAVI